MNAAGNYIPPMVIYKRKRLKPELTNGGPPVAVYACQEKGWMSNDGFLTWMDHFIIFSKPTKQCTVLLILDGHVTHTEDETYSCNGGGSRRWGDYGLTPATYNPPITAFGRCILRVI